MSESDALAFEPPGPGTWHLESLHFPKPLTRYFRGFYPDTMQTALNRGFAEYGVPLEFDVAVVNGYWYAARRPIVPDPPHVDARPESRTELEAEFRRRRDRMAETFETKRWRTDLERWDSELKPAHRDTLRTLQGVDLGSLDDDHLVDHIVACRDANLRGGELHHRMGVTWLVPVHDFLAHALEWIDLPVEELIGLLDGASPDSTVAVDALDEVVDAIEDDTGARRILFSDRSADAILDQLRSRPGPVSTAVASWLDVAGYRLASGYDLSDVYALEQPAMLLRTLRSAIDDGGSGAADHQHDERLAAVRDRVPAAHRERFDELFAEARRVYRLRDEREIDLWTQGLMRRALLEAGRRLVSRGQLHEANHAVDLTHEELLAALRDENSPSADVVADRVAFRLSHGSDTAPDRLGPEPADPFAGVDLPEPLARMRRAMDALDDPDMPNLAEGTDEVVVQGHAASSGTYEGRARVVSGPEEFAEIDDGDVLVAERTSSAFDVVLPLLGAIVTDRGGMLSHPAIVAREYGIPAVIGCEDATSCIGDGATIVVDGDDGSVRIAQE